MLHPRCMVIPTSQPLHLHFSSLADTDQITNLFCAVKVGRNPSIPSHQKKFEKLIIHQTSDSASGLRKLNSSWVQQGSILWSFPRIAGFSADAYEGWCFSIYRYISRYRISTQIAYNKNIRVYFVELFLGHMKCCHWRGLMCTCVASLRLTTYKRMDFFLANHMIPSPVCPRIVYTELAVTNKLLRNSLSGRKEGFSCL